MTMKTIKKLALTGISLAAALSMMQPAAARASVVAIDLHFQGDALAALDAIKTVDPDLQILPPSGRPIPMPVSLNLRGATITDALRTLGTQGGSTLDVVYTESTQQVRLVYHTSLDAPVSTVPDSALAAGVPQLSANTIHTDDGVVHFPFGYGDPTVICSLLMACDIALQPGEKISDIPKIGDPRWIVSKATSGDGDTKIVHVVVKPTQANLHTDLKVYTDKRTYSIKLQSDTRKYMSSVDFYYPLDTASNWLDDTAKSAAAAQKDRERTAVDMPNVRADQINLNYTIKGDKSLAWFPIRAWDDGTAHVYIEMPSSMSSSESPVLMIQGKTDLQMVNYGVVPPKKQGGHPIYVVDKLFHHAVLILGDSHDQVKVDIYKGNGGSLFGWLGGNSH